ncbi:MAG: putative membrane protein, conserved [Microgenomates group bacterium GW2011_GWB1_44_8]|nr:MAG: putative membrane protein, conserved [Microgenomates group bacterium GW2011_GWB1_44_8]
MIKKYWLLAAVIYLGIAVFIFRQIIVSPGVVGMRDDWSVPPLKSQTLDLGRRIFYSWFSGTVISRSLGEYLGSVQGILSGIFGFDGGIYSKLIPLFSVAASGFFFYLLLGEYKIKEVPKFCAGLVYMMSPMVFNSVVSGYILFLISYALLPIFFLFFRRVVNGEPDAKVNIVISSIVLRLIIGQDNFILIASILSGLYLLLRVYTHWTGIRKIALMMVKVFFIYLITLLLSFEFILNLLANNTQSLGEIKAGGITWNTFVNPTLVGAFFLDGAGYSYFYSSILGAVSGVWLFISALLLTFYFSAFLAGGKLGKEVPFYGLLAVFSLFIFKGLHPPFGFINLLLAERLPLVMAAFRNAQYVTVLTSFAYGFLGAVALDFIISACQSRKLKVLFISVFLILFSFTIYPFLTGNFGGNLQTYQLDAQYENLNAKLRESSMDYSVLWLPPLQPLAYQQSKFAGIDPLVFGQPKRALGNSGRSKLEDSLFYDLYLLEDRNSIGSLLSFLNVGRVILRSDFESRHLDFMGPEWAKYKIYWTNDQLAQNVAAMDFLKKTEGFGPSIEVFRSPFLPKMYIPATTLTMASSTDALLKMSPYTQNSKGVAVIFSEQNPALDEHLINKANQGYEISPATLEYKKIDPTKYKVVIHKAKDLVTLAFLEPYNSWWSLYLSGNPPAVLKSDLISKITIYEVKDADVYEQANKQELENYLTLGMVSSLHNKDSYDKSGDKEIGFISKNLYGSIQNDNLPNGTTTENWTTTPVTEEARRVKINGYANGWLLDVRQLCNKSSKCLVNNDGTYDLLLTVEFGLQKYRVVGLLISGISLVACVLFLVIFVLVRMKKSPDRLLQKDTVVDNDLLSTGASGWKVNNHLLSTGASGWKFVSTAVKDMRLKIVGERKNLVLVIIVLLLMRFIGHTERYTDESSAQLILICSLIAVTGLVKMLAVSFGRCLVTPVENIRSGHKIFLNRLYNKRLILFLGISLWVIAVGQRFLTSEQIAFIIYLMASLVLVITSVTTGLLLITSLSLMAFSLLSNQAVVAQQLAILTYLLLFAVVFQQIIENKKSVNAQAL